MYYKASGSKVVVFFKMSFFFPSDSTLEDLIHVTTLTNKTQWQNKKALAGRYLDGFSLKQFYIKQII